MTLLAPLFFAGLLAIGLPLWLHRLSAENPNRQRFSSLMLLEAGEPKQALRAFEATMKKEPNRFRGVSGAARAAELAGDRLAARRYYEQVLTIDRKSVV